MTREQLKEYLFNSGEINRLDQESKAWAQAFKLAKAAGHGDLDMSCPSCWEKVERFIRK